MARKAKKKVHPMPKLGWRDQLLYWGAMLLTLCGVPGSLFFVLIYHNTSIFRSGDVTACAFNWVLLSCFLMFWCLICFLLILFGPYKVRKPLFGAAGVQYGSPLYPEIYPLFMKNEPAKWLSPKRYAAQRKRHRIIVVALIVSLLLSSVMYLLCIYGRTVLRPDGSITVYNFFDCEADYYDYDDVTEVRIGTFRLESKGDFRRYMVDVEIVTTDGKCHRFTQSDFNKDWEGGSCVFAYESMLDIKTLFDSRVSISGADDLPKVVDGLKLNEEEIALLYQLFDINND